MRYCGAEFRDDAFFLRSAEEEADRIQKDLGLTGTSHVLEIGCGPGRTPIGLLARSYPLASFHGVDIDQKAVRWCERFISSRDARFRFHTLDAKHERYNPDGKPMTREFALPFQSGSFDIIYLHSVFAAMAEEDVRIFSREFRRLLRPDGRVFLTAFVEENVPPVTINPENYVMPCNGPLHISRYERGYLFSIFADAGLEVTRFGYGKELGGQSGVHLCVRERAGSGG
jgi:SAM-dependent methyltransferase